MESYIDPEVVGKKTISRSDAEAFSRVCHSIFDEIHPPKGDTPVTLVMELTNDKQSTIRQVHFVVWPEQTIPHSEDEIFQGSNEQRPDESDGLARSERGDLPTNP